MIETTVGKVLDLYLSVKDSEGVTQRVPKTKVMIDQGGVVGDKFYDKDIQRSILVTSDESYQMARDNAIEAPLGSLGENILIDYNPYHLRAGHQLRIGRDVILEITQNCTLCKSLTKVDSRLPKLLKDDRGVFVKTVHGGTVGHGDIVYLLEDG